MSLSDLYPNLELSSLVYNAREHTKHTDVFALYVSVEDTAKIMHAIVNNNLGQQIHSEFVVRGIDAALPMFEGVMAFWWQQGKTVVKEINTLDRLELLELTKKQQQRIKALYEHRQRL